MITGYRPSGFYVTGEAGQVQGETRQCVHCQYTWEYVPGSGHRRGFCLKCHGLLCGRPECEAQQRRILAAFPDQTRSCMPYADMVQRQRDRWAMDPRYEVTPTGLIVPR